MSSSPIAHSHDADTSALGPSAEENFSSAVAQRTQERSDEFHELEKRMLALAEDAEIRLNAGELQALKWEAVVRMGSVEVPRFEAEARVEHLCGEDKIQELDKLNDRLRSFPRTVSALRQLYNETAMKFACKRPMLDANFGELAEEDPLRFKLHFEETTCLVANQPLLAHPGLGW